MSSGLYPAGHADDGEHVLPGPMYGFSATPARIDTWSGNIYLDPVLDSGIRQGTLFMRLREDCALTIVTGTSLGNYRYNIQRTRDERYQFESGQRDPHGFPLPDFKYDHLNDMFVYAWAMSFSGLGEMTEFSPEAPNITLSDYEALFSVRWSGRIYHLSREASASAVCSPGFVDPRAAVGNFLVRNSSQPGCFAISCCVVKELEPGSLVVGPPRVVVEPYLVRRLSSGSYQMDLWNGPIQKSSMAGIVAHLVGLGCFALEVATPVGTPFALMDGLAPFSQVPVVSTPFVAITASGGLASVSVDEPCVK